MHTVARIALSRDSQSAALTMANVTGAVVSVQLLQQCSKCPGAAFSAVPVDLLPPLLPSPGVQRLVLAAPAHTCARLCVAVGELGEGFEVGPLRPLAQWEAQGPVA